MNLQGWYGVPHYNTLCVQPMILLVHCLTFINRTRYWILIEWCCLWTLISHCMKALLIFSCNSKLLPQLGGNTVARTSFTVSVRVAYLMRVAESSLMLWGSTTRRQVWNEYTIIFAFTHCPLKWLNSYSYNILLWWLTRECSYPHGTVIAVFPYFVFLHSLSVNPISDEGGRAIADALRVNLTLTNLKWDYCFLTLPFQLWYCCDK